MSAKRMARIAILAALCISLRFAFGAFPNIKPLTAIFLVTLYYLDELDCFLIMALTMIGSGLVYGGGSVILWQVLSYGVVLLVWRWLVLPWGQMGKLGLIVAVLAGSMAFLYSLVISLPLALQYQSNFWVFWLNGLPFDLAHALSTALFFPLIYLIFRRIYPYEKNPS